MSGYINVLNGYAYIRNRQERVIAEHSKLTDIITESFDPDISGEAFAKDIKSRLKHNNQILYAFYGAIDSTLLAKATDTIKYAPRTELNDGALEMLGEDETMACKIADGKWLPAEYIQKQIPEIGGGSFWGSSQSSFYSNILFLMAKNKNSNIDLNLDSSIFHVTPLDPSLAKLLDGYEYLYTNNETTGIGHIHSGFVFDGFRHDDAFYPTAKKFAPMDCSQFVQHILGFKNKFRTRDMLFTYRTKTNSGLIFKDWETTARAQELCANFVTVPIEDVQPGDIHLKMIYVQDKKATSERVHKFGHTTIVYSKHGSEVLTLGVGQTVPYRDGFGFETYSMEPTVKLEDDMICETKFLRSVLKNNILS